MNLIEILVKAFAPKLIEILEPLIKQWVSEALDEGKDAIIEAVKEFVKEELDQLVPDSVEKVVNGVATRLPKFISDAIKSINPLKGFLG